MKEARVRDFGGHWAGRFGAFFRSGGAEAEPPDMLAGVASGFGRLRLRTFIALRCLAIGGQIAALMIVRFGLGFHLPLAACLGAVGASGALNLLIIFTASGQRLAAQREAALQLAFDILQLAFLVGLTGGLANPFVIMMIAPVTVAAATLEFRFTLGLALLACAATAFLAVVHAPLPWRPGALFEPPALYQLGMGAAVIIGMSFAAIYAWRVSSEAQELVDALAAVQSVLERERRLTALGGLAAATAHELGTPLATIHLAAKEMLVDLNMSDPRGEDLRLIAAQSERCRGILRQLTSASARKSAESCGRDVVSLDQALEEAAAPFRDAGAPLSVRLAPGPDGTRAPTIARQAEIRHGLANFIENACSFARGAVSLTGRWDDAAIEIEIADDGPGFSPEVIARLGKPYVSQRRESERGGGLGLGFFIAKTLLERTGARLRFTNRTMPESGAVVTIRWPRARLEAEPPRAPVSVYSAS